MFLWAIPWRRFYFQRVLKLQNKWNRWLQLPDTLNKEQEIDASTFFVPNTDRPDFDPATASEKRHREIQLSGPLISAFIDKAWKNSPENEYMGWLTGTISKRKKAKNMVIVDGLFIPVQVSDATSVQEAPNAPFPKAMLQHMESSKSVVVGWVHSHPTFSAFFSSVDQHTMWMLQKDLPEAFGVVVDNEKQLRCLRLSEKGLVELQRCEDAGEYTQDGIVFPTRPTTREKLSFLCFWKTFFDYTQWTLNRWDFIYTSRVYVWFWQRPTILIMYGL